MMNFDNPNDVRQSMGGMGMGSLQAPQPAQGGMGMSQPPMQGGLGGMMQGMGRPRSPMMGNPMGMQGGMGLQGGMGQGSQGPNPFAAILQMLQRRQQPQAPAQGNWGGMGGSMQAGGPGNVEMQRKPLTLGGLAGGQY